MGQMPRAGVQVVTLLLLAVATVGADQRPRQAAQKPLPTLAELGPLNAPQLLDVYLAGRFDEAVQAVRAAGDDAGRKLRQQWALFVPAWIDADEPHRAQRILAAATFALETENVRAERGDWAQTTPDLCAGQCVVNWAYSIFAQRGRPDETEHAWLMAAISLADGVRDWRFLHRYVAPQAANTRPRPGTGPPPIRGLIDVALDRFPHDPQLRLHLAMAAASRFAVTAEGGRLTVDPFAPMVSSTNVMVIGPNGRPQMAVMSRYESRDETIELFRAVQDDPAVGAEARVRLGYLLWAFNQDAAARTELIAASKAARDADTGYLAHFLLGWTAMNARDLQEANTQLTRALEVRPGSQSATLALAAVQLQQGEGGSAYDLAQAALAKTDDDPWRLFLYGHHAKLPSRIADLRRRITAMSRRLLTATVFALAGGTTWLATPSAQQPQTPVFRARTSTVAVTASIKRGNNVVTNLTAADFVVTDNGVPQTVEAVAIENVPIDVTLFLDTSGSTAGKFGEMRDDVQAIIKLLRQGDKFRLLTIGDSVYESVPWVNAGATVDVSFNAVGGISLVQDALDVRLAPSGRSRPAPSCGRHDRSSGLRQRHFVQPALRAGGSIRSGDAPGGLFGRRWGNPVSRAYVHASRAAGWRGHDRAGGRPDRRRPADAVALHARVGNRARVPDDLRGFPPELRAALLAERRGCARLARDLGHACRR